MAEELQGLLDRLNEEGVKEAEAKKQEIVEAAKAEAEKIRRQAKDDAEQMRADAKAEVQTLQRSGEDNLRQAARDTIVSLQDDLRSMVEDTVRRCVGESMDAEVMGEIVVRMAAAYAEKGENVDSVKMLLAKEDLDRLEKVVKGKLEERFANGVTLQPVRSIEAGLQVSYEGQNVYHDISAEAVTQIVCAYLTPRLVQIVEGGDDAGSGAKDQDDADKGPEQESEDKEV